MKKTFFSLGAVLMILSCFFLPENADAAALFGRGKKSQQNCTIYNPDGTSYSTKCDCCKKAFALSCKLDGGMSECPDSD